MATRITVASNSLGLKSLIKKELSNSETEIVSVYNIIEASGQMTRTKVNILILDIDVPIASTSYIRNLIEKYNLLIILTGTDTRKAMDLFRFGPKDYLPKPPNFNSSPDTREFITCISARITQFIRTAPRLSQRDVINTVDSTDTIIAIASSTGGTEALYEILPMLPVDMPPILVVQHMPKVFTKLFADRLDKSCSLTVKEAENEEFLKRGTILIAPGDLHMSLIKRNNKLAVSCFDGDKVHGVRPAADILFNSIAPIMKNKVIGVILTGMGSDGAKGLYNMRINGSYNIGQSKETCVIYGMPKAAYDLGAIHIEKPLKEIPAYLQVLLKK